MSQIASPGSARVRSCTVNGQDFTSLVRDFKVWTSIFRPFRVGEAIIIDSQNMINKMKLKGNEDFEIAFDTGNGGGNVYRAKFKTVSVGNVADFPSARAQAYKIKIADQMYYNNQTVRVQKAYSNITGTDMIKKIYDEYLSKGGTAKLDIIKPSKGMIGTDNAKFIRSNEYPLASISSILKYLYANQSGNYVFYQDDEGNFKCGPLEEIVNRAQSDIKARFNRDPTVGKDSKDFNAIYNNIIGLMLPEKGSPASQYQNTQQVRKPMTFAGEKHDPKTPRNVQAGKVIGTPFNSEGDNYQTNFERRVVPVVADKKMMKNHPHWETVDQRQLYASILQNGPRYSMTVMGDSGINVTAGSGVFANIPEPTGDQPASTQNQLKGNAVVANSCKHLRLYDVQPQFTCTFDVFRGGVNKT